VPDISKKSLDSTLDEGVITLADSSFFPGFVLLYESIQRSYPVPVTCFDGGLTENQRQWVDEHLVNCTVTPIPDIDDIHIVVENLGGISPNGTDESMLWVCPFLISNSPYQRTLWLDADLIVVDRLGGLFELIDDGPVFTLENNDPSCTANNASLYSEMPLGKNNEDATRAPLVNAGVSGWDLVRDGDVIKNYIAPILEACRNEKVRQAISWHDQGCLIWAVQNSGLHERVLHDTKWNLCARHSVKEMNYSLEENLCDQVREAYPDANIVHWNGYSLQEKLFSRLGSEIEVLDSVLRRLPGPNYIVESSNKFLRIKLISHISSATSPALISHFINHYLNMGVEEFLVILHKVDNNSSVAENILSRYGIKPVMLVSDYSARLKDQRIMMVKAENVLPDDWIIYADVDELQVYPDNLVKILKKCDQLGHQSLTGQFVDRLAKNGELKEITESPSIWEQFPYTADVTSTITGGWTRKICVAKGSVSLNYSGSHNRIYGCSNRREYQATYLDITAWPENTEIHHFKWDKTLTVRVDRKINSTDGDVDAIDCECFINEYQSLSAHISKNKRIVMTESKQVGIPSIELDA